MISEEAVEAAAKVMYAQDSQNRDVGEFSLEVYEHDAREVLEAAAPHMIAGLAEQAWAEADEDVPPSPTSYAWSDKCVAASDWLEAKAKASGWVPPQPNPYRSLK